MTSVMAWIQTAFSDALFHAKRLHTLTDIGELHNAHSRVLIPKTEIRLFMTRQPNLEKIVADGRTWTVRL